MSIHILNMILLNHISVKNWCPVQPGLHYAAVSRFTRPGRSATTCKLQAPPVASRPALRMKMPWIFWLSLASDDMIKLASNMHQFNQVVHLQVEMHAEKRSRGTSIKASMLKGTEGPSASILCRKLSTRQDLHMMTMVPRCTSPISVNKVNMVSGPLDQSWFWSDPPANCWQRHYNGLYDAFIIPKVLRKRSKSIQASYIDYHQITCVLFV